MTEQFVPEDVKPESAGYERRIPVYLLLDTSGSMEGTGIETLNLGVAQFARDVAGYEIARDSVYVAVITFGGEARMITNGLVKITEFQPPVLNAEGVTRLDLAFKLLRESLDRDIRKPILHKWKGDGRPIVLVFTDGKPTDEDGMPSDNWQAARDSVVSDQIGGTAPEGTVRLYDIYTFGCGTEPDEETLRRISTGMAFKVQDPNLAFSRFIQLATMSSLLAAQRQMAGGGRAEQGPRPLITDDDLPPELQAARVPLP